MKVSSSVLASFLVFFSATIAPVTSAGMMCPATLDGKLELDSSTMLHYAVVPRHEDHGGKLCAKVVHSGLAWVAMAVSESGGMIGSEAIIGLPDDGTDGSVMKYLMAGKGVALVEPVEEEKQTLMDTSIIQDDTTTTLAFTKYLKEEDEREILENGMNQFIFAYGSNNALSYHGPSNKGPFKIDFMIASDSPPTMSPAKAEEGATMPPTASPVIMDDKITSAPVMMDDKMTKAPAAGAFAMRGGSVLVGAVGTAAAALWVL